MSDDFKERLRNTDHNWHEAACAEAEHRIEAQAAEIERLKLECQAQYDRGYYDGRQYDGAEERAKIVAWLHEAGYRQIADKIEAKEHLK